MAFRRMREQPVGASAADPVRAKRTASPHAASLMRRGARPFVLSLAAVALLSAIFLIWPGIDPWVSDLFYRPGDGFPAAHAALTMALRRSSTLVLVAVLLLALGLLVGRALKLGRIGAGAARRALFCLVGLVVGPGLIVNTLLKEHWGRPRPVQTDLYGGTAPFTGVWRITDRCHSNCSFVSGEASSSAWVVCALVVLAPRAWRPAAGLAATAYAVALSVNRIAFGGHYLSDVLLSWAITGMVLAALHGMMVRVAPERIDAGAEDIRA